MQAIIDRVVGAFDWDDYERPYECLGCGTRLDLVYHSCPKCGSFSIDRRSVTV